MSDFRIEIGFDRKGTFLPSDVVRLQGKSPPIFASRYLFQLAENGKPCSTVEFCVFDITQRIEEVSPGSLGNSKPAAPTLLEVTFKSARSKTPGSPLRGPSNPLILTQFESLQGSLHPGSRSFGDLAPSSRGSDPAVLPGWRANSIDNQNQHFDIVRSGAFLVTYRLTIPTSEDFLSPEDPRKPLVLSTDPEWIVGGGEEPD